MSQGKDELLEPGKERDRRVWPWSRLGCLGSTTGAL